MGEVEKVKLYKECLRKKVENIGKYIGNEWGLEDNGQLAMKLVWKEKV